MGNRIVGSFKSKLGQSAGTSEEELTPEAKEVLDKLRASYKLIGSAVAVFKKTKGEPKPFIGDTLIESETELVLVEQYLDLEDQETRAFKRLGKLLENIPIYSDYLSKIQGIGPAMAAVIISEIDITKAKYPSSIHAYCGLDVATSWVLQSTTLRAINLTKSDPTLQIPTVLTHLEKDEKPDIPGAVSVSRQWNTEPVVKTPDYEATPTDQSALIAYNIDGYSIVAEYRQFHTGGRSRKAKHLVDREYTDKNGDLAVRKSITFNPWLKTKVLGVLVPSFLRSNNEQYRKIYDDYKFRLENHPRYGDAAKEQFKDATKGHRHAMAVRYVAKIFLINLYTEWRKMEGLPVSVPYHEAKLGLFHGQKDAA
jgi:Transposase IS116/IS110/IS902 family